jgi:hypothetical protein
MTGMFQGNAHSSNCSVFEHKFVLCCQTLVFYFMKFYDKICHLSTEPKINLWKFIIIL